MALVQQFTRSTKERPSVHGVVQASLSVFTSDDGARYIQIDTYGSNERVNAGQVTQSIQLGREAAAQLRQIIAEVFPRQD